MSAKIYSIAKGILFKCEMLLFIIIYKPPRETIRSPSHHKRR